MGSNYYNEEDLKKFGIGEFQKHLAHKFFSYYGEVFKDSELSAREKSLIALAVGMLFNVLTVSMPPAMMPLKKAGVKHK